MQFCSNCGLPLRDNDNFCNNCGEKISKTSVHTDTVKTIETDDSIFSKVESVLKSRSEIITFAKNFPTEDVNGRKGTVDYIALTDRGIFIFNIVTTIGKITSTSNKHIWECNSIQFQSPIDKSLKDIDSVASFFVKRKFTNIFSYIIFPNSSDISSVNNEKRIRICTVSSLPQRIKDDICQYSQIYSNQDIREVSKFLSQYSSLEKNKKAVDQHTFTYTNSKIESSRLIMEENKEMVIESTAIKPKWTTAKLILGIISMVLFFIILFQSCAVGLGNALTENGESSGSFGFLVALNLMVSGIIAVAARKSVKKAPMIIAAALLWLNYFFAKIFGGSFSDLVVWGFISFVFGTIYLFSVMYNKKQNILVAVFAIVYFVIALL